MTEDAVLRVQGLRAGYRRADGSRHEVLRGVELSISAGELVTLLGPNGSGKTTLLRCVAGTLQPLAGTVELFGRPLPSWSRSSIARRVAVLPQSLELPEGFRVAELVEMGRAPHASRLFGATAEDVDAVQRALADAEAIDLADRDAAELSGGERQRVLLAMALAQGPRLLLLDEPTLHLDVAHQVALLGAIDRLRRTRRLAVLAVLHDLNLAAAAARRVVLLGAGRVVADGTPEHVLRPDVVRDLFGLAMDEAHTARGARFLVPYVPSAHGTTSAAGPTSNEPLTDRRGTDR